MKRIIVHCSATYAHQDTTAKDIDRWHKQRGWSGIGYHFVIRRNGYMEAGRPLDKPGAHAKGFNHEMGVCLIGGLGEDGEPEDNFTTEQFETLRALVSLRPELEVVGHCDLPGVTKSCPCFNVKSVLL